LKNPSQKRVGEVVQRLGLEFKPQYYKKKKVIIIALGFLPGEKLPVFPQS
jgi:hypothetical protein